MGTSRKPLVGELDRRELHLTIFACSAIAILSIGTAVLMYPVVFSEPGSVDKTTRVAFFGFCVLCLLLAGYLWERQRTIQRLRSEIAEDRRHALESEAQANQELVKTMPKLHSFQDSLPMEFRRTAATTHKLSILVVTLKPPAGKPVPAAKGAPALSAAAKTVSRKLRDEDSMFILGSNCIGAVLPGADVQIARALSGRIEDELAAAVNARVLLSYEIKIVNYPADASSAHELQQAVYALIPSDESIPPIVQASLA